MCRPDSAGAVGAVDELKPTGRRSSPIIGLLVLWLVGTLLWAGAAIEAGMSFKDSFLVGGTQMATAALMAIVIWRMSARLHWQPLSAKFVLAHLAAMVAFAVVYTAAQGPWLIVDRPLLGRVIAAFKAPVAGWQVFVAIIIYLAIAGVSYARRAEASLRESERARAEARVTARDAQLAALHAQLQPHFLFNALHTVSALVHADPERADRALDELGQMLRYALREPSDDVTLQQEWDFARDYLAFEALRLGPRLRVSLNIDDNALGTRVPSFLLQPLVENAVRHGAAVSPEGGDLAIRIAQQNGTVTIVVRNSAPLLEGAVGGMAGSGLRRLRERLELKYGPQRSAVETTTAAGDFTVTVTLPADTAVP